MRTQKARSGPTVGWAGSTDSTAKFNSGMCRFLSRTRSSLQLREESPDLVPPRGSAGEAVRVGADNPREPVTLVDADAEVVAGGPDPIHQECLHIGFEVGESGILRDQLGPRIQRQCRLGRPCGA